MWEHTFTVGRPLLNYLPSISPSLPLLLHLKESHIPDILRQAESLERTYSRYFDHTILFSDLDAAIKEVIHVADRLASEDQWVPTTWLDTKT